MLRGPAVDIRASPLIPYLLLQGKRGILSEQKSFHCHIPSERWRSAFVTAKLYSFYL